MLFRELRELWRASKGIRCQRKLVLLPQSPVPARADHTKRSWPQGVTGAEGEQGDVWRRREHVAGVLEAAGQTPRRGCPQQESVQGNCLCKSLQ